MNDRCTARLASLPLPQRSEFDACSSYFISPFPPLKSEFIIIIGITAHVGPKLASLLLPIHLCSVPSPNSDLRFSQIIHIFQPCLPRSSPTPPPSNISSFLVMFLLLFNPNMRLLK